MLTALLLVAGLVGPPEPAPAPSTVIIKAASTKVADQPHCCTAILHEEPFPFDVSEGTHIVFVPGRPLTKPHSHEFDDPFWGSAKVVSTVVGLGAFGDWGSTEWALHRCPTCNEANPFGQGKWQRIGLQVFFISAISAGHWGLKRLGAHTKAKILLWFAGGAKGLATLNNSIHALRRR